MIYTTTHLEDAIEKLYKKMGIKDPACSIFEMADKLNINIAFWRLPFAIPGYIALPPFLRKKEQKEVFAHELNHALYHVGKQFDMPEDFRMLQENKARNFALHFCIPTFMLRKMQLPADRNQAAAEVAERVGVTPRFALESLIRYENQLFGTVFHQELMRCSESRMEYEVQERTEYDECKYHLS